MEWRATTTAATICKANNRVKLLRNLAGTFFKCTSCTKFCNNRTCSREASRMQVRWITAFVSILIAFTAVAESSRSFTIDYERNCFLKDGEPFRYISGGMHYFRVPDFYWEDRLKKLRAAGLNAVQTYVAWNVHEPLPGHYVFNGMYDVVKFIKMAQEQGLAVIVRAGPYICAEWEFGGFPAWLLRNKSIILRSSKDQNYLNAVGSWLGVLLPKLRPLLYANGGPIIAVQVENEYGSYYTCDHTYMKHLRDTFVKHLGNDVILFTTDGYSDNMMKCGGIPELYRTVDFGAGDPTEPFKQQRKFQPKGPLVNSEYYTGWLDHWGEPHQRRAASTIATYLDKILAVNASVNMYMFEGGTNFGFMNGANSAAGKYFPVPTSYDYDAALTEAGDPTQKYFALRKVISKYAKLPPGPVPKPSPKVAIGKVQINKTASIYSWIKYLFPSGAPFKSAHPLTMEEIGQSYGFLLYRTAIANIQKEILKVKGLHDRAIILVDMKVQGKLHRNVMTSLVIEAGSVLDILVENQGRINYGPITDPKGILGNVTLGAKILPNWEMYPITFEKLEDLGDVIGSFMNEFDVPNAPMLALATFKSPGNSADTFLKLDSWTKGQAIINGHNLGRYWPAVGPQKTLYVPSKYLLPSQGTNSLVLFEIDQSPCSKSTQCFVEFVDKPNIG